MNLFPDSSFTETYLTFGHCDESLFWSFKLFSGIYDIQKGKDTVNEVWTNKNSTKDTYVGHKNRSQSCHCVQQSLISFLAQSFSALVKAADV